MEDIMYNSLKQTREEMSIISHMTDEDACKCMRVAKYNSLKEKERSIEWDIWDSEVVTGCIFYHKRVPYLCLGKYGKVAVFIRKGTNRVQSVDFSQCKFGNERGIWYINGVEYTTNYQYYEEVKTILPREEEVNSYCEFMENKLKLEKELSNLESVITMDNFTEYIDDYENKQGDLEYYKYPIIEFESMIERNILSVY